MAPDDDNPMTPHSKVILWLKSLAFNIAFYGWTFFCAFLLLPFLLLPHSYALKGVRFWIRGIFWSCDHILSLHFKIIGKEKLLDTPLILASKHQSAWETLIFHHLLPDPAIVLKQDLLWIPFFGWYLKKAGVIPLSRSKRKGAQDLKKLLHNAQMAVEKGQQILIFPEGTRSKPGQKGTYQSGVASLYLHLNLPVIPVAHNAGLFWPRRGFIKYPGTNILEFLNPIYPGLSRQEFMKVLENRIESKTNTLILNQ